ncbi:unnamed protein product [Nippostrongylus brasiliensis]|uniref:SH3 domain-containing protein n=1 Tax=Nippostrongylus brasiliensis TaxID=27835 RepID=A0A0N4YHB1_NIPBR|nr:unnamed protein product [Nippostrongylus brasiliensis]
MTSSGSNREDGQEPAGDYWIFEQLGSPLKQPNQQALPKSENGSQNVDQPVPPKSIDGSRGMDRNKLEQKLRIYANNMRKLIITARKEIKDLKQENTTLKHKLESSGLIECPACLFRFKPEKKHRVFPKYVKVFRGKLALEMEFQSLDDLTKWLTVNQLDEGPDGVPTMKPSPSHNMIKDEADRPHCVADDLKKQEHPMKVNRPEYSREHTHGRRSHERENQREADKEVQQTLKNRPIRTVVDEMRIEPRTLPGRTNPALERDPTEIPPGMTVMKEMAATGNDKEKEPKIARGLMKREKRGVKQPLKSEIEEIHPGPEKYANCREQKLDLTSTGSVLHDLVKEEEKKRERIEISTRPRAKPSPSHNMIKDETDRPHCAADDLKKQEHPTQEHPMKVDRPEYPNVNTTVKLTRVDLNPLHLITAYLKMSSQKLNIQSEWFVKKLEIEHREGKTIRQRIKQNEDRPIQHSKKTLPRDFPGMTSMKEMAADRNDKVKEPKIARGLMKREKRGVQQPLKNEIEEIHPG